MTDSSSTLAARWLRAQKAEARSPLRTLWMLAPLGAALIVAQAWLLAQIVHAAVFEGAALTALQPALLGLLGVFALRFVVSRQTERQAFHAATAVKRALRERLFDKLRALGPLQLATQESGAISTSLIDGVEQLDAYFARFVPALTLVSVVPLVILLATLPSDGLSAVVLLVTAPLLVLFMVLIGKSAEAMSQRQWRELSRMGAYFLDLIQTLATRKMFNASRRELTQIARVSDAFRRTTMSVLRVAFLTSAVLEFFAAISIALIAVFIGFRLLAGEMQFVHGFFVLLLAPEFYLPLRNYGVQNHARMEAVGAAEQIVRILELPETEGILGADSAATEAQPELSGAIELQQLSFAYEAGRPALSELTLRIEAGEHLAIVGPSGAGKTTLLQLLLGFAWADRGAILIGRHALTPATVRAWRQQIGWIPQRASLFHGSVADNLRLGAPLASDAELRDALRQAQASDFVDALPQGLDTVVGDGGCGLSGGQIQRLAIARALLRKPRYLLLDEPTAHLDPENERRVTDALQQVSAGRTVINVTHRLASLRHADRIAVLSGGAIVQLGSFDTLANTPGLFAQMLHERRELSA